MISVYVLVDPNGEIRYVGVTSDPRRRLRAHRRDNSQTHKARWIRRLAAKGRAPIMRVIQEIPSPSWVNAERYWVNYFRAMGCPLTNSTDGGDGVVGLHWSEEQRRRASQTHKTSARAIEARRIRTSKPEFGAAISAGKRGKPTKRGWKHSTATRALLSDMAKRRQTNAYLLAQMVPVQGPDGRQYRSLTEAERITGVSRYRIRTGGDFQLLTETRK
jgi:hypothetical protein